MLWRLFLFCPLMLLVCISPTDGTIKGEGVKRRREKDVRVRQIQNAGGGKNNSNDKNNKKTRFPHKTIKIKEYRKRYIPESHYQVPQGAGVIK